MAEKHKRNSAFFVALGLMIVTIIVAAGSRFRETAPFHPGEMIWIGQRDEPVGLVSNKKCISDVRAANTAEVEQDGARNVVECVVTLTGGSSATMVRYGKGLSEVEVSSPDFAGRTFFVRNDYIRAVLPGVSRP